MGYATLDEFATAIIKAGGGKGLIIKALKAVHDQGYNSGYEACALDMKKAKQSRKRVADKAFKKEMEIIDDVMKSKWL
jgi:hypothetical protein